MSASESTVAHGPEHGLERLIFFSDAVFAIAITLLVIEIHVPHLHYGEPDVDYWIALANLAPQFSGFFISFFVIGFFWAGHHRTLAAASHYAPSLNFPNLLLLSAVAAIPFFTAFVSANPMMRVPVFCYCGWLFLTALANRFLQHVVTRPPVMDDRIGPERAAMIRLRGNAVILGAATAMIVSLVVPVMGQMALATMPWWRLALRRWSGLPREATA